MRDAFGFLLQQGFKEVEALPTLVRYRKNDIEVDIYHGRGSYEIGCGVSCRGDQHSMWVIIGATDEEAQKNYRNFAARTPEGVTTGLRELSTLLKRYGGAALAGDPEFFSLLEAKRKQWSEEYAMEIRAGQLRPLASEAFRLGDYEGAAKLYEQFRPRLSPAELKKLEFALKHRAD